MSSIFNIEAFKNDIEKQLNYYVEETIKEIIDESIEKINTEIRKKTGSIAAQLFQYFEFNMDRNRLIISVDFKNLENK